MYFIASLLQRWGVRPAENKAPSVLDLRINPSFGGKRMGWDLCTITQENEEQFDGNGVGCYECVSL